MPAEPHAEKRDESINASINASGNATSMVIESDRQILIERTFNGPPPLVFAAWTRADLVRQWWAPRSHGVTLSECTADVRVGGKYRYVMRLRDGSEVGFSGEYLELSPPARLVYTQCFEPMAAAGFVTVTVTFEALPGGKTRLSSRELYPSKEALDAALSSGMEHGMRETMDQLDALLPTLAAE
jgi:uncharacterized protein YndB with AHSA1/START domain